MTHVRPTCTCEGVLEAGPLGTDSPRHEEVREPLMASTSRRARTSKGVARAGGGTYAEGKLG